MSIKLVDKYESLFVLGGRLGDALAVPALADLDAIINSKVIFTLPILLDDQLGDLVSDGHAVALSQLHYVLERQLPLCVREALVHPLDSLIRKRLPPLVGFLRAEQVHEGGSGEVGVGAGESADDAVVLPEGTAPAEVLGGGGEGGDGDLLGVLLVEVLDEGR